MMVYTDGIHLVADSLNELHSFAEEIGLKRHYFEGVRKGHPHYDLLGNKLSIAIAHGVKIVSSKEVLVLSKKLLGE
mgnify:CR=1 FL=1